MAELSVVDFRRPTHRAPFALYRLSAMDWLPRLGRIRGLLVVWFLRLTTSDLSRCLASVKDLNQLPTSIGMPYPTQLKQARTSGKSVPLLTTPRNIILQIIPKE